MKKNSYQLLIKRLDSIVGAIDSIKEDVEELGGFLTEDVQEQFEENLESAVISIQDAISDLEGDEAYRDLKNSSPEDEENKEK